MGSSALERLRRIVVDDPQMRGHLLAAPDRSVFVQEVVDLASGVGIELSRDEIVQGLLDAEQAILGRWV